MRKYTIKQIFKDHWAAFVKEYGDTCPDYVLKIVEKMLCCRDAGRLGYHKYACSEHPECFIVVPHSCKTKFCNACGTRLTDQWMEKNASQFPNTPYYHIVFTISDLLRSLFYLRPDVRTILFQAAKEVIIRWAKAQGFVPAITCVLHTFGRNLGPHYHIHMIVSAGGLEVKGKKVKEQWVKFDFIPYEMLRTRWKTVLLLKLKRAALIPNDLKEELFAKEWYVHVGVKLMDARATIQYIGRYARRPPLSETRIVNYDGERVTFYYEEWNKENSPVYCTVPVFQFISLLIQHIPPPGFKMIRHYGLLANRGKKKYASLIAKVVGKLKRMVNTVYWRMRRWWQRGRDPLKCKICQREMALVEYAFPCSDGGLGIKQI